MHLLSLLAQAPAPVDNGGGAGLLVGGGLLLVALVIGLLVLVFWLWALIDAIRNPALSDTERIVWITVILLTSWLGALIYLFIGRKGSTARPIT